MLFSQWLKSSFVVALSTALCSPLLAQNRPYQSSGYKFTAIPIVNFSSDDGAGYGAPAKTARPWTTGVAVPVPACASTGTAPALRADYGKADGRTGIYITFRQLF